MSRTSDFNPKQARREAILAILGNESVHNQGHLAELLESRGQGANQATLSRDLRDLGVVKGSSGYILPGAGDQPTDGPGPRLLQAARQYLRQVLLAQNQVLIKTPPGGAQPLAVAIDAAPPRELMGTLAGDDTILIITADAAAAAAVAAWLEKLV